MKKNKDLRVIRTRTLINDAFFELIDTIGFEKITVKNLTEQASICRTTFYLHYQDKYDLLNNLENDMVNGLNELVSIYNPQQRFISAKCANDISQLQVDFLAQTYQFIKSNHQTFTLILNMKGNTLFIDLLSKHLKKNNNLTQKINIPQNYLLAIIIGIQTSVIMEWLNTGMQESPQELATLFVKFLNGNVEQFLKDIS